MLPLAVDVSFMIQTAKHKKLWCWLRYFFLENVAYSIREKCFWKKSFFFWRRFKINDCAMTMTSWWVCGSSFYWLLGACWIKSLFLNCRAPPLAPHAKFHMVIDASFCCFAVLQFIDNDSSIIEFFSVSTRGKSRISLFAIWKTKYYNMNINY